MRVIQSALGTPAATRSVLTERISPPPRPRSAFRVLFLCADNSICSIMAEALLKRWGGQDFHAFSAGIVPRNEIDPLAADLLKTCNVWNHTLRSKSCKEFLALDAPRMDFIVSLGGYPLAGIPTVWPGHPQVIHWRITEPLVNGSPNQQAQSFKTAFRELETRIKLFVLVYRRETMKGIATAA
jgi:arsenate reductase